MSRHFQLRRYLVRECNHAMNQGNIDRAINCALEIVIFDRLYREFLAHLSDLLRKHS